MRQTALTASELGATCLEGGRCRFTVWAPRQDQVSVHLVSPNEQRVALTKDAQGYHRGEVSGVAPGSRYFYTLRAGQDRPDPASRHQPLGVQGPSQVIDPRAFCWHDQSWRGLDRSDLVIYELHVGLFTAAGTFDAVTDYLDELRELGVTAIELMPVAAFPGSRNWGYDGVCPFAAHAAYGGPDGLRRLVDVCHASGLAVILDVVYNHLGPEGNYLAEFGPYFTTRYQTPWGPALNFDGPDSDEVRRYFLANALYWLTDCHVDGLRLDAVHAIFDQSARPFLADLAVANQAAARRLGRRTLVIAESDRNDARFIQAPDRGGMGLDAQWSDDFHHALHTLLTGERDGYYQDFGTLAHLAAAYQNGYTYTGQTSTFRRRRHGNRPEGCAGSQFVICTQNHDQVGNRALGERLSTLTGFAQLKLAAAALLLAPYVPLLFMGEEYGETAPFLYFTSHTDPKLAAAVRVGRREEFSAFAGQGEVPDPQDLETFRRSRLNHGLKGSGAHAALWAYYRELLRLRRQLPVLADLSRDRMAVDLVEPAQALLIRRWSASAEVWMVLAFSGREIACTLPIPAGRWQRRLDAAEERWLGPGTRVPGVLQSGGAADLMLPPHAAVLLERKLEA